MSNRFKKVYEAIEALKCTYINDQSGWRKEQTYVNQNRPLWIILESSPKKLRLWLTLDFGEMKITTAKLDLDPKSKVYSDSHRIYPCENQKEMVEKLHMLLHE